MQQRTKRLSSHSRSKHPIQLDGRGWSSIHSPCLSRDAPAATQHAHTHTSTRTHIYTHITRTYTHTHTTHTHTHTTRTHTHAVPHTRPPFYLHLRNARHIRHATELFSSPAVSLPPTTPPSPPLSIPPLPPPLLPLFTFLCTPSHLVLLSTLLTSSSLLPLTPPPVVSFFLCLFTSLLHPPPLLHPPRASLRLPLRCPLHPPRRCSAVILSTRYGRARHVPLCYLAHIRPHRHQSALAFPRAVQRLQRRHRERAL